VHDREFAGRQIADFQRDLKSARRITLEEWQNRPHAEKAWEHVVGLFGSQL
jgi:phosphatidylserine/phosphatidylglycerophosphate/cardiolipin synthase-like enzyme